MLENETAAIFQGQGGQHPGMGKELYDNHEEARRVFEAASEALDMNVATLCFTDPENRLQHAGYAQPAIVTVSFAAYKVLQKEIGQPGHLAGHSLGEYSAAAAGEALGFPETLKLVRERGMLIEAEATKNPGAMVASLGVPLEKMREICAQTGTDIANDNSEGQTVISGLKSRIDDAIQLIGSYKGKVRLLQNINVPSHSSLMEPVSKRLLALLQSISVEMPVVPLVSNVTAKYVLSVEELKSNLAKQVMATVRWRESVIQMVDHGAEVFYEIGPGDILKGIIRKINPSVEVRNVNDLFK